MNLDSLFEINGKKKRIDLKISVALLAIVLLCGIVYIYMVYYAQREETKQYLNEVSRQSAMLVNQKISADLATMQGFVAGMVGQDELTKSDIIKGLETEYELFGRNMLRLSYIQPDGLGYAITDGDQINQIKYDLSGEEYQRALAGETVITTAVKDALTNEIVTVYYVPVVKDDEVIAIHCGVNRNSELNSVVSMSYFDGAAYSTLIDSKAEILFNLGENIDEDAKQLLYTALENNKSRIVKNIAENTDSSLSVVINNEDYWITYNAVDINDWYVVLVVANSTVNKMSNSMELMNYVILLLVLLVGIVVIQYINSMRNKKDKEIVLKAYTDEKTGILNKEGMSHFVTKTLKNVDGKYYAFVYFDIENFKTINDLFGYSEGDLLLKHCARVLSEEAQDGEFAGRLGGDNFYILIAYKNNDHIKERVRGIMRRISEYNFSIKDINKAFDIIVYAGVYKVSNSNRYKSLDFFVDRTNMSMARVTKKHENDLAFYNDDVRKNMVYETELENEMKPALERGEFEVYIQPKYNVQTGRLAGGEALIRWNHSTKGFLSPAKFIHIFERNGMIIDLDMFVLETVCKKQREWLDEGLEPFVISVNQSRVHLYRKDYIEQLQKIIEKYNIKPEYIELEITETVAIASTELLSDMVGKMHSIGFRVSMDDFGSGQSALNLLKDIDIDVLKIDRSFFLENSDTVKGKKIIESVLDMAARLDIETVSEGIETMEQFDFIKAAGCNLVQSFLFGKPMPIKEYEQLFRAEKENNKDN